MLLYHIVKPMSIRWGKDLKKGVFYVQSGVWVGFEGYGWVRGLDSRRDDAKAAFLMRSFATRLGQAAF